MACVAPVIPEVLRWAKIAIEEDHTDMLRIFFGILSWIGLSPSADFKDSLPEFVDLMLESEKCQDLFGKCDHTHRKPDMLLC